MRTWRRWIGLGLLILVLSLLLSCLWTAWLNQRSERVIWQNQQPPGVSYGGSDPYVLSVVEGELDWSELSWFRHRYYLVVGKSSEASTQGYRLEYGFHPRNNDVVTHIQLSKVIWDTNGLIFTETPEGNSLRIPRESFAGDR